MAFVVTTLTLPAGVIGVPYLQTMLAAGALPPYMFSIVSGSLPAGLSLSALGVISGAPLVAATSSFTVRVTDSTPITPQTVDQLMGLQISVLNIGNNFGLLGIG